MIYKNTIQHKKVSNINFQPKSCFQKCLTVFPVDCFLHSNIGINTIVLHTFVTFFKHNSFFDHNPCFISNAISSYMSHILRWRYLKEHVLVNKDWLYKDSIAIFKKMVKRCKLQLRTIINIKLILLSYWYITITVTLVVFSWKTEDMLNLAPEWYRLYKVNVPNLPNFIG